MSTANGDCQVVRLSTPLKAEYARLVRLLGAAVAQECGFGIDRVDDVRLAVEEAFLLAVALATGPEPVDITMTPGDTELHIVFAGIELGHEDAEEAQDMRCWRYGLFVLNSIADEARIVPRGDRADLEVRISQAPEPESST